VDTAVEALKQVVRGELDLLVAPLGSAEVAGDDARSMDAPEVAEDEGVPRLGLVVGARGQTQMPACVRLPIVLREIRVLVVGARLDLAPVAVEHVLASVDEPPGMLHRALVDRVAGHRRIMTPETCKFQPHRRFRALPGADTTGIANCAQRSTMQR